MATGTSAASLNPENITEVCWWEDKSFRKQENREAAELVAFEVLDPALRSRGATTDRAKEVYADADFRERMATIFRGEPTGRLVLPNLEEALERILQLEKRVSALEEKPLRKESP